MTETSEMTRAYDEAFADPADAAAAIIAEHERATEDTPKHEEIEPVEEVPAEPVEPEPQGLTLEEVTYWYNQAFAKLEHEIVRLKRRPWWLRGSDRPERRTGAAARVNPDDIRVFRAVLVGSLLLPLITFAASFQFQRAFGVYTPLEEAWWWVIPCILELPLVVLTPVILIFRRRHESTIGPWITMIVLTAAASAINFIHAVTEQGLDSVTDWAGAVFVAAWPVLTLVTFKFFSRLAVKPEPKTEAQPAPRKTPQKKGNRK